MRKGQHKTRRDDIDKTRETGERSADKRKFEEEERFFHNGEERQSFRQRDTDKKRKEGRALNYRAGG